MNTPTTLLDGYKIDHRRQYPDNTKLVCSNFTARGTRRPGVKKVVFFGLQYFLKEYMIKLWNEKFFSQPKDKVVAQFVRRVNNYAPHDKITFKHMEDLHDLGYLPLAFYALPEGTEYPLRVAACVVYSTHENFAWLTNNIETILSTTIWLPCTSATTAHQYKKLLTYWANKTVGNSDFVPWQAHDFSFRGMAGLEAAKMSGAAHLVSFTGTDTVPAIDFLEEYYNADCEKELIGGSVIATEHAVACSQILKIVNQLPKDMEEEEKFKTADVEYVRRLICDLYPTGIVSIVSDSFDYWNTITNTARILKDKILGREGKTVFRPDTGDPVRVVCGEDIKDLNDMESFAEAKECALMEICDRVDDETPHGEMGETHPTQLFSFRGKYYKAVAEIDWNRYDKQYYYMDGNRLKSFEEVELTPEQKGSIECLWDIFGGTISEQGYKVLDPHVGLIYGDSITFDRCKQICEKLAAKGFASTNIVYGVGSFTYQYVTRDTDGYAMKATWVKFDDVECEVYKKPKADSLKASAKGLVAVYKNDKGEFYQKDQATWEEVKNCEYVKVFENGVLLKDWNLGEVRANLQKYLV